MGIFVEGSSQDGRSPHIQLKEDEISRYIILPGSHERVRLTAAMFDESEVKEFNRDCLLFSGKYQETPCQGQGIISEII